MSGARRLRVNLSPLQVKYVIPAIPENVYFSQEDFRDLCRRHEIPREQQFTFEEFLFNCGVSYHKEDAIFAQHFPNIASRKDSEALFKALSTFLELYTSPGMVPRILFAYRTNRRKCTPEQNAALYQKTVGELEMLLVALESAIDFDGRIHLADKKVKHALRLAAKRILNYWTKTLQRSGSLSRRSGEGTALAFVLDCLGLITGTDVSEHAIRGIDKADAPPPKRKRTRVRRRAAA